MSAGQEQLKMSRKNSEIAQNCRSPSYTNVASLAFPVKLSTSSASTIGSAKKAAKKKRALVCTTDGFIDSQV